MKKFMIISAVLIIIAGAVFSFSLYHYFDVKNNEATADQVMPQNTDDKKEDKKDENLDAEVPAEFQDGGIFSQNYDKAYQDTLAMTNEQMVAQLIIGTCPTDGSAGSKLDKVALGGYYFTDSNFTSLSKEQIKEELSSYQKKSDVEMILAVEEEGGAVTALSDLDAFPDEDFYSPREIFAEKGLSGLQDSETQKAQMLSSVGINLNLAPVCDMAEDFTQIMYSRSLGGTPQETSQYVKHTTQISQGKGVSVALKHFPGYGTIPDTYLPVVADDREASTFESRDFLPFKAGIDSGAHCVLMSNILSTELDPNCIASLSDYTHTILRNELKFTGLIITDNLNNADYSEYANGKDVYVQAILAGNDMIMVDDIDSAYNAILKAVNDDTIKKETVQKACMRVLAYKYTAKIIK